MGASKGLLALTFLWFFFCLLSGHPARGRDVPKDESIEKKTQNGSILYANGSVRTASQTSLYSQSRGYNQTRMFSRRYSKKELARDISPSSFINLHGGMAVTDPNSVNHWSLVRTTDYNMFGIKATISVYGLPTIKAKQLSSAEIWVANGVDGPPQNFNSIQAGWHVHPELYGDHETHFFIYWTADGYQNTGCYNFLCKGFVRDNSAQLVPGNTLQPVSQYNGEQRYITVKINKDSITGDWWLHSGDRGDIPVGYWPKNLFTSLANSASNIDFGGTVGFIKGEDSPPMGSGHYRTEGEGKAASFKNVRFVDGGGFLYEPTDGKQSYYNDKDMCYTVGKQDFTFYFGGPGGCKD